MRRSARLMRFHAATVAVVISDHGPFSPRVLIQRAMETAVLPPSPALNSAAHGGAETRLGRHGQERKRGGIGVPRLLEFQRHVCTHSRGSAADTAGHPPGGLVVGHDRSGLCARRARVARPGQAPRPAGRGRVSTRADRIGPHAICRVAPVLALACATAAPSALRLAISPLYPLRVRRFDALARWHVPGVRAAVRRGAGCCDLGGAGRAVHRTASSRLRTVVGVR